MFSTINYSEWMLRELRDTVMPAVYKNTNGALKIDIYAFGEHPFAQADLLKAARDNACQLTYAGASYISSVEPAMAAADLPMIMPPDIDLAFKIYDTVFNDIYKPVFDRWNVQEVMTFLWPPQRMAAKVPILNWDSLKGQRIRTANTEMIDFINMLGGTGVSMAFGEVAAAMATGLVAGCISNSGIMYDSGFYEQCKYLNIMEAQIPLPWLAANKGALAELPADVRDTFLKTMREYQPYIRQGGARDADQKAVLSTVTYGTTLVSFPKAFRAEIEEKTKTAVWEPWLKRAGPDGEKALNIILTAKQKLVK